jgi:hypothetical protein
VKFFVTESGNITLFTNDIRKEGGWVLETGGQKLQTKMDGRESKQRPKST